MLLLPVTACAPAGGDSLRRAPAVEISGPALCAGTDQATTRHAAALGDLDPSDPRQAAAIRTGEGLILKLDAGCLR